ncbi:MAG: NUDIX domain-containing protein [Bacilli bacterium]|nr:NUDIX domain-containing protein [Bacilli bacterium]
MLKVVGTIFLKDNKLLIDKPRTKPTHQMIGGKVEEKETPLQAAIRECYEELGPKAIFDESKFEQVMDFDEIATSDPNLKIHFYVFKYNGNLEGTLETSEEIESFLWYDTSIKEDILSNTLKHKVIPYCIENNLIK